MYLTELEGNLVCIDRLMSDEHLPRIHRELSSTVEVVKSNIKCQRDLAKAAKEERIRLREMVGTAHKRRSEKEKEKEDTIVDDGFRSISPESPCL